MKEEPLGWLKRCYGLRGFVSDPALTDLSEHFQKAGLPQVTIDLFFRWKVGSC